MPDAVVRTGFVGENLAACLAFLKAKCHSSYSSLRSFVVKVLGCPVSRGELVKTMAKLSKALAEPYAEALDAVSGQAVLNIDETGRKEERRVLVDLGVSGRQLRGLQNRLRPVVEPTSNAAEQTIRFVVLDPAVTQGTRGSKGREGRNESGPPLPPAPYGKHPFAPSSARQYTHTSINKRRLRSSMPEQSQI